jgi:hypothetical protein
MRSRSSSSRVAWQTYSAGMPPEQLPPLSPPESGPSYTQYIPAMRELGSRALTTINVALLGVTDRLGKFNIAPGSGSGKLRLYMLGVSVGNAVLTHALHGVNILEGADEHLHAAMAHSPVTVHAPVTLAAYEMQDDPIPPSPSPEPTPTDSPLPVLPSNETNNGSYLLDWLKRQFYDPAGAADTPPDTTAPETGNNTPDDPLSGTTPAPAVPTPTPTPTPTLESPAPAPPTTEVPASPPAAPPTTDLPPPPNPTTTPDTPSALPTTAHATDVPPPASTAPSHTLDQPLPGPGDADLPPPAAPPTSDAELASHYHFTRPPHPDEYLWTYYHNQGVPPAQIMSDLHRDLEQLSKSSGAKVTWVTRNGVSWPVVNGHSDTTYIWRLLAPYGPS